MFENAETLWVLHIGKSDRIALRAKEESFVAIGWAKLGDLSRLRTREDFRTAMRQAYPDAKEGAISARYGQVYRFARVMREGDPLVYPIGPTKEIAIGKVAGPHEHRLADAQLVEEGLPNVRKVEWLKIVPRTAFSQSALYSFGAFLTVSTSNDYLGEVVQVLRGEEVAEVTEPEEGGTDVETGTTERPNLYDVARQQTEDYLLKRWQRSGYEFEHIVAALMQALGYTARVTQASGDHGVDVIAHPDPLGVERPYIKVQAKSGTGTIGEPDVARLKGSLQPGEKGIIVALGVFSSAAQALARSSPDLILVDGTVFVQLFLDNYLKLDPRWQARFPLKQVYVPEA